jgi:predicted dehydrogenase
MPDELRVGFLGFGFIGKVHAYGYQTFPFYYPNLPRARFVAVCTSRPASAEAARAVVDFERATTDFRAVTEADDVDVVHVATPNALHRDALLSAMAAGKHIYCEKPLVTSAAEADEIEAALAAYTGTAQMVLQNRFFPATRRAKELADSGFLGDVLAFRAAYLHAGSANPDAPLKWKLDRDAAGGGVLFDLGSHVIDLVTHLVGDFVEVDCRTKIAFADRPALDGSGRAPVNAEDLALVTGRTAGGALGTVEATKIATGSLDEIRFEVHGTRGAMRFNGMRPNWLELYDCDDADERGWRSLDTANQFPPPAPPFPGPKFSIGWIRSHVACLANFIAAVAAGEPAEPSLARGIALQRMMAACYRSAGERRPVTL